MRNTFTKLAIAASLAAMFAPAIIPVQAQAAIKTAKAHYVEGQFANPPTIVMKNNGSAWLWDNKNDFFQIAAKIKVQSTGSRMRGVALTINNQWLWGTPKNGNKFWKLEKLVNITLNKNHLAHLVPSAANVCKKHGSSKKVVKSMPSVSHLRIDVNYSYPAKVIPLPVRVVCLAKQPSRVPVPLKVTKLKLYTVPAKLSCGKPLLLVTEIHTNKPGKVDFVLMRGDGAKQNASLTTQKAGNGYVKRWSKKYQFNKSVNRKYAVIQKGKSVGTSWVPVKVSCGLGASVKKPKKFAN